MQQRLKEIMAKILRVSEDDIVDTSSMATTERWDSLKHMELILAIEEEFRIPQLTVDEIATMTSLNKIKQTLRGKGIQI